jgi:hypothetical protein
MKMESITADLKVRIFQGDSSITRSFKVRKLSDGTVVLDDGTRRIVQRPKYHPDHFQAQVSAIKKQHFNPLATLKSVVERFGTNSIVAVGAQIPGWIMAQLQTSAFSHFNG